MWALLRPKPSEFAEALAASYELLEVTERCLLCPEWEFTGTVEEGRAAALQHRKRKHPKLAKIKKRPSRHLHSFRQSRLSEENREDIMAERTKRARLLGLQIE